MAISCGWTLLSEAAQAGRLRDALEAKRAAKQERQNSSGSLTSAGYIKLQSGGLARQYILHKPLGSSTKPIPLVIVLHGTVGTGEKMRRGLGFDSYANQYGFSVAYPDAYISDNGKNTTRWNDGRDTLESTKLNVDDVRFIRDMVDDIAKRIRLDRSRICVTGPSNGGIMTYRLICEASDLFAAAAPVIGNIAVSTSRNCTPSHPLSVLAINGTEDPFVPFDGGTVCQHVSKRFCEKGEVISADASLGKLASQFACERTPDRTMLAAAYANDPQLEYVVYDGCANHVQVSAYWIHGGGHTWPPQEGQLGSKNGKPTRNLDATKSIVQFFMNRKP